MLRPILLLSLALILPVQAAPGAPTGPIETDELKPLVEEMGRKWVEAMRGLRNTKDVLQEYSQRASAKAEPREQAISLFLYGRLLFAFRRIDDGVESIKSAIRIYPAFPDAHVALGRKALTDGDTRAARRHARKARKIDANNVDSLLLTAEVLQAEDKWKAALDKYIEAACIDPNSQVIRGMAMVYVQLFKDSYDDERRTSHAANARRMVDSWVSMEPDKAGPRVFQSQVYFDLGLYDQAAARLEQTLVEVRDLSDRDRKRCLGRIFLVRVNQGNVEAAKKALKRVLKLKSLSPEERTNFEKRLADISKRGLRARFFWEMEGLIETLSNTGISAAQRREAMRKVLRLLSDREFVLNPEFTELVQRAYVACIKTLKNSPPELSIDILQFFRRQQRDPLLLRVIVHFVFPAGIGRQVTPIVRVEATRTLAEVGQEAALPTLLYTLRDDSRLVSRAIDVALCGITERRSPIGTGSDAVTEAEQKLLRVKWTRWACSEDGADKIAKGIVMLEKAITVSSKFNRAQQKNPIGDHVISVVLLDNDMQWKVWKTAYDFIHRYLAKDFLPPELRGKEVTEDLRPVVVKEIGTWWRGAASNQAEAEDRTAREATAPDKATKKSGKKNSDEKK